MEQLNELLKNEYDAMSFMDIPTSELLSKALETVRAKITDEEYMQIEANIYGSYIYVEKRAFEQGFLRGITVAKGGAA